ncbi:UDP-N-acetylmuramoyl-tripeptide--D-alanyl-D-alanine ligase [Cohnella endophytica]|uniref:UDP-N-acetylmuramoyl-tripeptide--D-alanyl-D-alanine ligase n=1 Tax=Cohnella endophytica TaxID=2419778 RepID=A0A494Y7I0_9BACL|nr:UDP-N-acetylmuramoyl-tripeptide--D-alanyl-D-alanine ligase [Cohnella endophytica]RKP58033.1 UDP-N-acetylmuramoyl-tripeptide--D-alanyl-D-alanine ligase [Cohnella endophytica]
MILRTLQQVSEMGNTSFPTKEQKNVVINGVSIDSRTLRQGNLYIPIVGERFNGHAFVDAAIEKGASAVLWNREEPNPPLGRIPVLMVEDTLLAIQALARSYREQLRTTVIGITGSNGKTSTKDMLAECLSYRFKTRKTTGNLNNHLGVPLTLLSLEEDTEMAVVEMGMSGLGEIELLSVMAKPDIAIITNIGEAHLGDLGSLSNIAKAKTEIVAGLKPNGILIYNGNHILLSRAIEALKEPFGKLTFGEQPFHHYYPSDMALDEKGSAFTVARHPGIVYSIPLAGKHQVLNALAVIATALDVGMDEATIRASLANVRITGMRNEIVQAERLTVIDDTYKSNPSSAVAALETLYLWPAGRQKLAVLGDMHDLGEQDVSLHHLVGTCADPERLDYLFVFGPLSLHTADGALRRMPADRVFHYLDKQQMTAHLRDILEPDAVVLIKASRAMQMEDIATALTSEGVKR